MATKKSNNKIVSFVLDGLMAAALIVGIVGLFLHFAVMSVNGEIVSKLSAGLFDLENTAGIFAIIFAIVSVVAAAALLAVNVFTTSTGKELKLVKLILTIVTIAASVAFLICAIVVLSDSNKYATEKVKTIFGAGPYLIFFGTLLVPCLSVANKMLSK